MNGNKLNLVYESSITALEKINSSFDKGVLKIAYPGENHNHSFISKSTFEKSAATAFNCPIVCNYDRDTDSIGSHDIEVVKSSTGMKLINVTQPVGVVPESSKYWWETITEEDGSVNEYFCLDVIIWRRQEAYSKIKSNGITSQSMEINVLSGKTVDGIYYIDSFEFTAFCLLESAKPCFESACLEMFSFSAFKDEYAKMMNDFKETFKKVNSSEEVDIYSNQNLSKGGSASLEKMELVSEYGVDLDALDFNIDDFTIDELREKFEAIKKDAEVSADEKDEPVIEAETHEDNETESEENDAGNSHGSEETYSLTANQLIEELLDALYTITYTATIGDDSCEYPRYIYVDHNTDVGEVYCCDMEDGKLYGFAYSMNGDHVVIDFECKKRKKMSIVDFDEGADELGNQRAADLFEKAITGAYSTKTNAIKEAYESKLNEYEKDVLELSSENASLKECAAEAIFSKFSALDGVEQFDDLRENHGDMSLKEIENKCFELKGRYSSAQTFSINKPKSTRIAVKKTDNDPEPYGGLILKYSSNKR